jgi:predicted transcriptional regulator
MDFKDQLILMFYNNKKKILINDILRNLGMTLRQLQDKTDSLIDEGYLFLEEDITFILTEKGKKNLEESNMIDIDILNTYIYEEKSSFKFITPLSINDIYIPKKFDKKVGK